MFIYPFDIYPTPLMHYIHSQKNGYRNIWMTSCSQCMNTSGGDAVSPPVFWNVYMPWASSSLENEG